VCSEGTPARFAFVCFVVPLFSVLPYKRVPEDEMGNKVEFEQTIRLSEMLATLRTELEAARAQGRGSDVRFNVEEVELTVQLGITRTKNATPQISFWVIKLGGSIQSARQDVHTLKLKLRPVDEEGKVFAASNVVKK
jgi:hypothetical protein